MKAQALLISALLLIPASVPAQPAPRPAIAGAIDRVYPSLVRISVVTADHRDGREVKFEISGSGTIISADGYVVTNHHVAGRARRIACTLFDKQEVPADLVGTDPLSDISVLKLRPSTPRTFPFARFGDSAALTRGDAVLAMGSPLALSQSVTLGIVSNMEMIMPGTMRGAFSLDGEDVGTIVRWIGHDAAIYPGNSGGPLVNLAGEIVGVNEISFGLAGAIPASLAQPVAESLIKTGHVRRSWTGLELQPMLRGDARQGALVSWVAAGSPAATAGVASGDVLVAVNGGPVDVKYAEQLPLMNQRLSALPIGRPARLDVSRPTGTVTVAVTPDERPAAEATPAELREWGMVAADLTPPAAREMARASTDGIEVLDLQSGGAAEQARPALRPGDVIVELDGKPIRSVAELQAVTAQRLRAPGRASVLVAFDRDDERRLTIVALARPVPDTPAVESRKASLPVDIQVLTPALAARLGLEGRTGVRITRVRDPQIPLRVGDIVLAIDGAAVKPSSMTDETVFATLLRQYPIGATVTLTVSRDGTQTPVPAVLVAAPRPAREMQRYASPELGFHARELADEDLNDPRRRGMAGGVVVDGIESGGWAALARLRSGDVILDVDGEPVASVDQLGTRLAAATTARRGAIVFKVRRGIRTLFVQLEPLWK